MARCEVCDLELDEVERFCPGCGVPAPRRVVEVSTGLRESFHSATSHDDDTEYAFGTKRVVRTASPPPPASKRTFRERGPKARTKVREDLQPAELVEDTGLTGQEHALQADEAPEIDDGAPAIVVPTAASPGPIEPYVVLPVRRAVAVREPELVGEALKGAVVRSPTPGGWTVVVIVLALLAGSVVAYALAGEERTPAGGPFTAEARDGAISLDAPAGWRLESRGDGVLGIGEAAHDMHVHATAIRRSALADGLSLKRRAEQVHEAFIASLDGVDGAPAETTKVGRYAAIRHVLSTTSVTYVHTVAKMPTYFVNVLAWTSTERFREQRDQLLAVVGTLQSPG